MELHRQPGCWLRSSHTFKECVIAHWSSDTAPKMSGAKRDTEAMDCESSGRGAMCTGRSRTEKNGGRCRRENAGMSSESHARNMAVESPRFPGEGSSAQGKSGPKPRTRVVGDGQQVHIPALPKE